MNQQDPPVDMNRLKEFTDGTEKHLRELVELYLGQTGSQVRGISAAVAVKDLERAKKLAHSSAGSSGTCGMRKLSSLLRDLETAAQQNSAERCAALAGESEQEFARIEAYLRQTVG